MSTYEISKSSLLSLKAEIIRKQQELSKVKAENEVKRNTLRKQPLDIKNKGIELREKNDQTEVDEDLLKKSRSVLEYKTELYERLSKGKHSDQDQAKSNQYLVRFGDKKSNSVGDLPPIDSEPDDILSESDDNLYESDGEGNPLEKWVDYVDCLGRTRRCMQKDLEYLKSKDMELSKIVEEKKKGSECETESKEIDEPSSDDERKLDESVSIEKSSELLSSDMRREMLRQQWEREEEALLNKKNIHYQDILFGEARTHGVGYYNFSKDEEERAKQQGALKKLREETQMKQKRAQELRNTREKLLAARLKSARNRKRARMGLPPEEDEPEPAPIETTTTQEEQKKIDEKEKLLEQARKNHVRPWDIGKEGVKEHRIMSQEEWVEQQREERQKEFAPPTSYRKHFRADNKDSGQEVEDDKCLKFSTKKFPKENKDKRRYNEVEEIEQSPIIPPTPIQDLNGDGAFLGHKREMMESDRYENESVSRGKGTEIPPPPTYQYYGPSESKIRKPMAKQGNISQSIEAGLKFLRKQVEEKEKSTKHPEDMFLF